MSLANDGDTLLWSVTRQTDNTTESGKIVDREMFELRGGAAKYQITITGDSVIYFDNFSLNNIEPNAENYVSQKLIAADSFESYDVMDTEQHSAVEKVGENWQSSSTYRGSDWNSTYMGSQVVDNGSKMLRLEGYGGSYPNDTGCFNYIGDLSNVGSDVKMSVDMKAADAYTWEHKGGIRFIAHNNDKNYYGLFSDGYHGRTYFEKVINGEVAYSEKVSNSQTMGDAYYEYMMEKRGNKINYSVINKTTKSVLASGTYIDDVPFNPAKLNETYQLNKVVQELYKSAKLVSESGNQGCNS
ncbi:MAG: hypothetical protein SOS24_06700 [Clostridia bacterium]|nr:hypothetical protein [Clostridia bacterium]